MSKMTNDYTKAKKQRPTIIYLRKKAPYVNPNERKVNQQSYVCANRFYEDIQDQRAAVSYFLDNRFARWEGRQTLGHLTYANKCAWKFNQ